MIKPMRDACEREQHRDDFAGDRAHRLAARRIVLISVTLSSTRAADAVKKIVKLAIRHRVDLLQQPLFFSRHAGHAAFACSAI